MADNNETVVSSETSPEANGAAAVAPEQNNAAAAPEAAQAPAPAVPVAPLVEGTPTPDLDPELEPVAEVPYVEVPNGRPYELTFIVKANDAEIVASSQAKVNALIEGAGGAVDHVRVSEVRRLAYPIAKEMDGIYIVINARFEKTLTEELDRYFKLDEGVLRHIILRENA